MANAPNAEDHHAGVMWGLAVVLVLVFVVHMFFGNAVASVYLAVRHAFLSVLVHIWPRSDWVNDLRLINTHNVREISSDQISAISGHMRFVLLLLFGTPLALFARRVIKNNPGQKFRRRLTREQLAEEMVNDFPWILPALRVKDENGKRINLVDIPIDKGPWAMALSPREFVKRRPDIFSERKLDEGRARIEFIMQLGQLWTNPSTLQAHQAALFVVFSALVHYGANKANMNSKERDFLKDNIFGIMEMLAWAYGENPGKKLSKAERNALWARKWKPKRMSPKMKKMIESGKIKLRSLNDFRKEFASSEPVRRVTHRHAFQSTVMIAMFFKASEVGIFPPNFFLWLRPLDPLMWRTLDCVMRQTYFVQCSGIYAHYLAEKEAGHKIEEPRVDKAILALGLALSQIRFDDEERDDWLTADMILDFDANQAEIDTQNLASQFHSSGDAAAGVAKTRS